LSSKTHGFSLTEMLLSVTLLMIGVVVAFSLFDFGTLHFRLALMRQGLQADGRKAMLWMERDLRQSCIDGISRISPPSPPGAPRHGMCLPAVSNLTAPANFNPSNGRPRYNRINMYYATSSQTPGKLFRVEFEPSPLSLSGGPWAGAPSVDLTSPPFDPGPPLAFANAVPSTIKCRMLTNQVMGYAVATPGNNTVQCVLTLRGGARVPGQERDELIQLNLYVPVYNRVE